MEKQPKVSLRQLAYFVAVAEHSSFRRAADKLGVSQPTLTAQIASLEQSLGTPLFERSRAGTVQSPMGRELLGDARNVLDEFRGLLDHAAALNSGPGGTYRLGVTPTTGPYLLPQILPDLHAEYAALKFYVREGMPRALEEGLVGGRHDLILTPLPLTTQNLTVVPLFKESLKLVVPSDHRLANRETISHKELRGEAVLTLEDHDLLHRQIERVCERLGAVVRRDYEGTSLDTLRQMVVMGMGLTFLPALYIRSEIREGEGLCVLTLRGDSVMREHALVWRATSPGRSFFRGLAARIRAIVGLKFEREVTLSA